MREEYLIAGLRGVATGAVNFAIVTLTAYQGGAGWEASLVAGGIGGLTVLASFFGLGIHDARRNDAQP
jgi:hypothetical protein